MNKLDQTSILTFMSAEGSSLISSFEIFPTVDSTNSYLLEKQTERGAVCLAEMQTAGRGRQNKQWHSPANTNMYLSIAWEFETYQQIDNLSVAVGESVVKCLDQNGIEGLNVKLPNDIYYQGKKVAGILIETKKADTKLKTVVGLGLNVNMNETDAWTSLKSIVGGELDRNEIAGLIITDLLKLLSTYHQSLRTA